MNEQAQFDNFQIDFNNKGEMNYIAERFCCRVDEVRLAFRCVKSFKRGDVYRWLLEYTLQRSPV